MVFFYFYLSPECIKLKFQMHTISYATPLSSACIANQIYINLVDLNNPTASYKEAQFTQQYSYLL